MSGIVEWAAMDGHGPYIWASYALFLVAVAFNVWWPTLRRRQVLRRLDRIAARDAAFASAGTARATNPTQTGEEIAPGT